MNNSRKQRFLALASRQGHTRTLQPLSSPPRLPCRSPGSVPSVASLSRPEPHLSRVYKLTRAHNYPHTGPHTPITDHRRAGTHSHFTHAQTQPHQSTALLRVVMDRPLGAVEAPQLLLLSAPFSACRAPHDSAARESSSVLPVEYSSLSREFRAAGSGSQLHTRWRRRDGPPARPARRCRAVSVRFKRSGPPAGTNDTSDGRGSAAAQADGGRGPHRSAAPAKGTWRRHRRSANRAP